MGEKLVMFRVVCCIILDVLSWMFLIDVKILRLVIGVMV